MDIDKLLLDLKILKQTVINLEYNILLKTEELKSRLSTTIEQVANQKDIDEKHKLN